MKSLIQRLIRMDHLITYKRTGKPAAFARKIGISDRSLYDYLRLLRDMGAPICFSRNENTYYYKEEGNFKIRFIKQSETDDDFSLLTENWEQHSFS
jgi:predicted DNA-binding transcriptional regulator YafY